MSNIKRENKTKQIELFDEGIVEKFNQYFLEYSNDAIVIFDQDLKTIRVSKALLKILDYSYFEFKTKIIRDIFDDNSVNELISLIYDSHFLSINEFKLSNLKLLTSKRDVIYTEAVIYIVPSSDNRCFLIAFIDSSKLLFHFKDAIVKELYKNDEAQKFKSIMLSLISHEFKTPLTSILGFVDLLIRNCSNLEDLEMLEYVLSSAKRLNAILNSISNLAAIESEQLIIRKEHVDLSDIIVSLRVNFDDIASKKGIELLFEYDDIKQPIFTDDECIRQILYHLIDNALKFTYSGYVKVVLRSINDFNWDYLEMTVSDTGIGIAKEKISNIFEPFRQGSEGINRNFDGLGIGLTIAEKIVKKLDGIISIDSEFGKGSVFKVIIPLR